MRTLLRPLAALLLWTPSASAELELVSKRHPSFPPSDTAGGGYSNGLNGVSISADGRYAVYSSSARNLVEGQEDENETYDVFLRDLLSGTTILVSRSAASPNRTGNGESSDPVVSADGRYVVFRSLATDLVPGQSDGNGDGDLFLYDRITGTTTLVSRSAASASEAGNGESFEPAVSADGAYVAFLSESTDLVSGQIDTNSFIDVFLFDRAAGTVSLVSHAHTSLTTTGNGSSQWLRTPALLSADGRFVAFDSNATNLVSGVTNVAGGPDAFLYDRTTGAVTHLSRSAANPANSADSFSWPVSISGDGGRIILASRATDLLAGLTDTNGGLLDVFVYERSTGALTLVSRSSASPTTTGNGESSEGRISGDGSRVVFESNATNMIPGGAPPSSTGQIFLYELATGAMTLVSRSASSPTTGGNSDSFDPWIGENGTPVAFRSRASNLVAGQTEAPLFEPDDAFFYDAGSGSLTLVSRSATSPLATAGTGNIALSADGGHLLFWSWSDALAPDVIDTDRWSDVFVYSAAGDSIATVSVRHLDLPSATPAGDSLADALSADGRFLAFTSSSDQLVPGQTPVDDEDPIFFAGFVFLHDRLLGTTTLVSHAAGSPATPANSMARVAGLSGAGNFVLFESGANDLVSGMVDPNLGNDLFLWERTTGTTTLVSHAAGSPTIAADSISRGGGLSADGRYIAMQSNATDLVPGFTGALSNTFLVDRVAGTTTLVSGVEGSPTTGAGGTSAVTISAEGRHLAYESLAENLIPGQDDNDFATDDVFLYDRLAGTTQLVSHAAGFPTRTGNDGSSLLDISADGRYVAILSNATDLVAGFTSETALGNAYVFDRVTGTNELVSRTSASATEGAGSIFARINADGRFLVFLSSGSNLVPGQTGPASFETHVYLFDRALGSTTLVSHAAGAPTATANGGCSSARISADGRFVSFSCEATDLVPGQTGPAGEHNAFVYDRLTGATRLVSGAGGSSVQGGNGESGAPLLSASGSVLAFSSRASDLVDADYLGAIDLFVSATPPAGTDFFTVAPCRVLDTRSGPSLSSGVPRRVKVTGACGIADTARAVAVNVTAISPTGNGRLTVYPGYLEPTGTSTLSFQTSDVRANGAIVSLALNGTGTLTLEPVVTSGGTVHATVDVTGYFE